MLFTSPPTISPREAVTVVAAQEPSAWSTAGEVATVVAGLAAAGGLIFTGLQVLRSNRREAAHEHGRARRVGVTVGWPMEGRFLYTEKPRSPLSPDDLTWLFVMDVDVVNGNDTSITDVHAGWRRSTDVAKDAVYKVHEPPKLRVLLPQKEKGGLRIQVQIFVTKTRAPFKTYTDPWDTTLVRDEQTGMMESPGVKKWDEVAQEFRQMGEVYVRWELDGVFWEYTEKAGVKRTGKD